MTLIRVKVVLLMGLRGEPAAGGKRTERARGGGGGGESSEAGGGGDNKQRRHVKLWPLYSPRPSTPQMYMHRDTPTHTAYTRSHLANKQKKKGLSAMKRAFGSKNFKPF